ncbi:hypothetical protein FACS1894214_2240 [Planctomycetales bacterium]|nr:hypothetical protein FACS1894214_2240 [Planctomycetales bacterium]
MIIMATTDFRLAGEPQYNAEVPDDFDSGNELYEEFRADPELLLRFLRHRSELAKRPGGTIPMEAVHQQMQEYLKTFHKK